MDKFQVHQELINEISKRQQQLNQMIEDVLSSTFSEFKSTAGDKHETGRAMAQLEQEKIGKQIQDLNRLADVIHQMNPETKHTSIQHGSLIQTNKGWYYLSIGIGQIQVNSVPVFCMTAITPLGKELSGKKAGQKISWMNQELIIESVS